MTKLNYPQEGIYNVIKDNVYETKADLANAKKYCSFNIPYSFRYRSYLQNLDDLLLKYEKQMDQVLEKAKKVSQSYENLEIELNTSVRNIENPKLKAREKIIK